MISEENRSLLEFRILLLQEMPDSDWLFRYEKEYLEFLKSLNTSEIRRIAEVDYPLFELNILPKEIARYSTCPIALEELDKTKRMIYESNLHILANRWRISQEIELDEIRYNTKEPLFASLRVSTFLQIQLLAAQPQFVSKFGISLKTLKKMVVDESLTRMDRNRMVING